ncbi:MAG: hypothetical protein OXI87_00615 [Albidovulum sp.]|nr:hypothetical protein [Albidovulum sp.]MDE0534249.1 hypothetical protein [Albidovulum sp.]
MQFKIERLQCAAFFAFEPIIEHPINASIREDVEFSGYARL